MTMLDNMRRHKAWLKWSLGLVVVAFVLLYVPSFMDTGAPSANDTIATVDGRVVKAGDFRTMYAQQVDAYRQAYGANLNDQLLKQLGIEQRLIQQMIDEEAVLAEARRLGLSVTDSEVQMRILRLPALQENGVFVGYDRYRQMLDMQRPPLTAPQFEEQLRRTLLAEKVQAAVTGWVRVSDADVEREYRSKNEKVKLELAVFNAAEFRGGIQPTDAELQAQFTAHADLYQIGERRRVRFLSIDAQALRSKVTVTDAEIQAQYQANIATYSTPEQVHVRHILLKTEGKDDAKVKAAAEAVLAKVKAPGADFAKLATQFSEDEGSKEKGGEYDFFGKGTMVKEFEEAAWALKPDEISGLVKTQFGYHIIKLTNVKPSSYRPLEEVKGQLQQELRRPKADALAKAKAEELQKAAQKGLDAGAKELQLTVRDSGFFGQEDSIPGVGKSDELTAAAFTAEPSKVSDVVTIVPSFLRMQPNLKVAVQGYVVFTLAETRPPQLPPLEEVRPKVERDLRLQKAKELARQEITAITATLAGAKTPDEWKATIEAKGYKTQDSGSLAASSPLPGIADSTSLVKKTWGEAIGDHGTFELPGSGDAIFYYVRDKKAFDPAEFSSQKKEILTRVEARRRSDLIQSVLKAAQSRYKVEKNDEMLRDLRKS